MFRGVLAAALLSISLTLGAQSTAFAAEPSTTPQAQASPVLIDPLDPRTGENASSVGAPFVALVSVIGIGVAAAALTFVYVRVARRG